MYTPGQFEQMAKHCDAWEQHDAARMLRYAATLKAAQGGVTDAMPKWPNGAPKWGYVRVPAIGKELVERDEAEARIKEAAPPAQQGQGDAWDGRGGSLWLDREQWGVVIDALIEHRASAAKRKNGKPDSTSDVRADECGDLIGKITNAAKSLTAAPAQPAERVPEGVLGYFSRDDAEKLLKRKGEERINFSHIEVWNRQSEFYPVALAASPAPSEGGKGVEE